MRTVEAQSAVCWNCGTSLPESPKHDRLRRALEDIARLDIPPTRGTSAEFALKRLSEAIAIAREAIKEEEGSDSPRHDATDNEKVSDGGLLTPELKQDANPPFATPLG